MDILWTSYGHPLDILPTATRKKVFTSYGHLVDILWAAYGHPTYSDQKRSSHPGHFVDILWTSYGQPTYSDQKVSSHPADLVTALLKPLPPLEIFADAPQSIVYSSKSRRTSCRPHFDLRPDPASPCRPWHTHVNPYPALAVLALRLLLNLSSHFRTLQTTTK